MCNRIAKDWRTRHLLFFEENEEQRQERELQELNLQITALRKQIKRAHTAQDESGADMPERHQGYNQENKGWLSAFDANASWVIIVGPVAHLLWVCNNSNLFDITSA